MYQVEVNSFALIFFLRGQGIEKTHNGDLMEKTKDNIYHLIFDIMSAT